MHGLSLGLPGGGPLSPGTHFCALYSGADERDRLLFPFLDEGLRHGDMVWCLVDDIEPSLVRDRVAGRDHPGPRPAGRLDVARATDVCLRSGEVDVDVTIQVLSDRVDAAEAAGFELLRAVGEMSWVLPRPHGGDDLLLHESALNRFVDHAPAIVMCLHDLKKFGADGLVDVLRTHAKVLLDGAMVDNPYYVGRSGARAAACDDATAPQRLVTADEDVSGGWGSLTLAELRVASHVSRGTTNRTIAADLQVSRHTVDAHLKHIYLKLRIHSRVELTVLVLQHRLVLAPPREVRPRRT
ncbi:MEDS domain-containing protein [Aeromicrobium sp. Leaf350]|uniref:MEDS domain-containing protein n=1 Tax=Aeromicrobium sp. Leaf350 TaxID=2876565 RepID=UPI001E4B5CD4|nr:MEDS domain-containing protein [Aeromicrobium sp. Leaf350]